MEFIYELIGSGFYLPVGILVALLVLYALLSLVTPKSENIPDSATYIGSYVVIVQAYVTDPDNRNVKRAAESFGAQLAQYASNHIGKNKPLLRLREIRAGSLIFDYDIYIAVTGAAIFVLKDYSDLKAGLKDLLEDLTPIKIIAQRTLKKIKPRSISSAELRLMTEEELRESLRNKHRLPVEGEKVKVHVMANEKNRRY